MTIANGLIYKSATIAGVVLSGNVSASITDGDGQVVDLRSDGELRAKVTPIIPGNAVVDFECKDISSALKTGDSGSLSLVADKMTGGTATAGTITVAAASVTILPGLVRTFDLSGLPVMRGSARVNSADGIASGLTFTSA